MKEVLCLLLILALLLPAFAVAEGVDLSALSFDQLVQLRDQIARELTTRPEWKEVTVPQGVWEVGVDIPEGHWVITAAPGCDTFLKISSLLDETGTRVKITIDSLYIAERLTSKSNRLFDDTKNKDSFDVILKSGWFVLVDDGSVVFTPFTGKPSLGF